MCTITEHTILEEHTLPELALGNRLYKAQFRKELADNVHQDIAKSQVFSYRSSGCRGSRTSLNEIFAAETLETEYSHYTHVPLTH